MEAALKAIAEPRRRQILVLVRDGEMTSGEIASHFEVTRPAISQHLTVLTEAGLVSEYREGKAVSMGGEVVTPITEIPDRVTWAEFRDPAGDVIGISLADS
jgi:DNA-binding transcriptional ArsR family regulator